jgi:hypothetical protein
MGGFVVRITMFNFLRTLRDKIANYIASLRKKKDTTPPWPRLRPLSEPKVMTWKSRR